MRNRIDTATKRTENVITKLNKIEKHVYRYDQAHTPAITGEPNSSLYPGTPFSFVSNQLGLHGLTRCSYLIYESTNLPTPHLTH